MANKYLIIGGGHQGLTMAAHLAMNGEDVYLWNRTYDNIAQVAESNSIFCTGLISGEAKIKKVSSDIDEVMCDTILVTLPSNSVKDIARMLSSRINDNTTIVLNPGRTFGALEFRNELLVSGCKANPIIAETQTIVYTCRRDNTNRVNLFALKKDVFLSALNHNDTEKVLRKLPDCLRKYFRAVDSIVYTSLGNVGMILHCAPMLMNIGWIESKVAKFEYYYDGISLTIAKYLEKMDAERLAVVNALGYQLETTKEWLQRSYNVEGKDLYECILNNDYYRGIYAPDSISHRYINEDLPFGLVPVEYLAKSLGIATPTISIIIDLACAVMECDYRVIGRKYSANDLFGEIKL